jgi:acyl-CoA synthetase (AMP-forming)/AMP-acid ligase II
VALKDKDRAFTYPEMNRRVNQLAHSLLSLGLRKGDKVAVLLENCIEIVEVFLATAKTGIIIVPINFRLVSPEVEYIAGNSDAKAFIVHDQFVSTVEPIRNNLNNIAEDKYVVVGQSHDGYLEYEALIKDSPREEPEVAVAPGNTWILLYTSGTTSCPFATLTLSFLRSLFFISVGLRIFIRH